MCGKNYEDLANGIIEQAAYDYKKALITLRKRPKDKSAKGVIREVEKFFKSSWFRCLTDLDAEFLIKSLRKEYGKDESKNILV